MTNVAPDSATNDPLGYQRFALTESAYDLITSLTGIYARLRFQERQKSAPDTGQIAGWQQRINELQQLYKRGDWSDLPALEKLIAELAVEYKQHNPEAANSVTNAADKRPKAVPTH